MFLTINFVRLILWLLMIITAISVANAWREASKCTLATSNVSGNSASDIGSSSESFDRELNLVSNDLSHNQQLLSLNCGTDLIFIASSHYGHKTDEFYLKRKEIMIKNNLHNLNVNISDSCYFSSHDCIVAVDYVANECNGLSSCQISLDSQYLHSCKSYSDYLFIIYDCVEAKSTVNICDNIASQQFDANKDNEDSLVYIQSPSYPNEYINNLDCNCVIKSSKNSSMQIELLEFDLESTNENLADSGIQSAQAGLRSTNNLNTNPSSLNTGIDFRLIEINKLSYTTSICSKDFLSINKNLTLCGTMSQFSSIMNIQKSIKSSNFNLNSRQQLTSFRLYSDDALTRRGFWLKIKVSKEDTFKCPDNYILINNACFKIINEYLTWYEAHNYCNSLGHSLLAIDNFEFEKKINKILFENEETAKYLFNSSFANANSDFMRKFWIGVKHLNKTNWFDANNNVIKLRNDEKKWWPWLVVDPKSYNQGSCVGKRRGYLFLEDCYKRMPFACQLKPSVLSSESSKGKISSKIELKCGKHANEFFLDYGKEKSQMESTSPKKIQKNFNLENLTTKKSPKNIIIPQLPMIINRPSSLDETNNHHKSMSQNQASFQFVGSNQPNENIPISIVKADGIASKTTSDSTLIIGLICSITFLIVLINTIVVALICKRRKKYFNDTKSNPKNNHKTISSKLSNASSASSGNNLSLDDSNGTINSSSLTFNGARSNKNLILFKDSFDNNSEMVVENLRKTGGSTCTSSAGSSSSSSSKCANNDNQRRSIFINNFETIKANNSNNTLSNNNHNGLIQLVKSNTNANMNVNGAMNSKLYRANLQQNFMNNKILNNNVNDPLSHIYETISVSSYNANMNTSNNNYNNLNRIRYNNNSSSVNHNINNDAKNNSTFNGDSLIDPYIDIESEFLNHQQSNPNQLININNQNVNHINFLNSTLKYNQTNLRNQHLQTMHQHHLQQQHLLSNNRVSSINNQQHLVNRNNSQQTRFTDINAMLMANTTSPSCSSFTTTTDTNSTPSSILMYNNSSQNFGIPLQSSDDYNNCNQLINENNRHSKVIMNNTSFNMRQQHQMQHDSNNSQNNLSGALIFPNRIEAVV